MTRLLLPLIWACHCATGSAEELVVKADARASLGDDGPYWVGQSVPVMLELRSTAFALANQRFDAPAIDGALMLDPSSGASQFTEQREGETWQVQRYEYRVFPQRPGSLHVPAFDVGFSASAGYGKVATDFVFKTEPLVFDARLPPGATADRPLVTTRRFEVEQTWDPAPDSLKVGDAVTRRVVFRAQDLPGMALPTLSVPRLDGIVVYPEAPTVQDTGERGSLQGERIERHTFVMQQAGSYQIPGGKVQWWNPQTETLTEVAIEPLEIEVAVNPALLAAQAVDRLIERPWLLASVAATALLGLLLLFRGYRLLRRRRHRRAEQLAQSEQGYFERLQQACRGEDAALIYSRLTQWLGHWRDDWDAVPTLDALARRSGDPALAGQLDRLQRAVAGRVGYDQGAALDRALVDVRKQLQSSVQAPAHALPALNPRGQRAPVA